MCQVTSDMTLSVSEYATLDATALADLVRSKEATASELADVARSALAEADTRLNALAFPVFADPLRYRH